jgi:hypothetical protein
MEGTNGTAESLPMQTGDAAFEVHACVRRIVEHVPSTCVKKEDLESDKEDLFLHVFAAEKKKHDLEIVRARLPKYHQSAPSTLTSGIPSAAAPTLIAPAVAVLAAAALDVPPSLATAVSATPLVPTTAPTPAQTVFINELQACCIKASSFENTLSKPHLVARRLAHPRSRQRRRNQQSCSSHRKPKMTSGVAHTLQQAPSIIARSPVIKDPDKGLDFPLRTLRLRIIGLTEDGQDFDPPRGVRWRIRLRAY